MRFKTRGALLAEVLITVAILGILIPALGQLYWAVLRGKGESLNKLKADYLVWEYVEGARVIKDRGWENLVNGKWSLSTETGKWELVSDPEVEMVDGFERGLEIMSVYRDLAGEIIEDGGVLDRSSKRVRIRVAWSSALGQREEVEDLLLTRLESMVWIESLRAEFEEGAMEFVLVTEEDDGELQLAGGCIEGGSSAPYIFDDEFGDGWKIGPGPNWPQAQIYAGESFSHDGDYSFRIEYPHNLSWTYIENPMEICTEGFRKFRFWAYNDNAVDHRFGMRTGLVVGWLEDIVLPAQEWTEIVVPYLDINDGEYGSFSDIYFRIEDADGEVNVYYDQMELIEGTGGYYNNGVFISDVFDAGVETVFNRIFWEASVPEGSDLGFQVGISSDVSGPFEFFGPGGTSELGDFYTDQEGEGISWGHGFGRYLKYKAYLFSGDGNETPTVYSVGINYVP